MSLRLVYEEVDVTRYHDFRVYEKLYDPGLMSLRFRLTTISAVILKEQRPFYVDQKNI
jgi:hypothetical protein